MAERPEQVLDPLAERYLSHLRVEGGLATNTLEAYRRDLSKLQAFLSRHRLHMNAPVSPPQLVGFLASLKAEGLSPASMARTLSAMRGWFGFLVRERIADINPTRDLATARRGTRLPSTLTMQEVTALLELPAVQTVEDARDRTML
ncbi:MAG TPA: site-specific integrase, partial [Nitrospira sp.]|nr:site-specific integrase [Nitrospira sp.]